MLVSVKEASKTTCARVMGVTANLVAPSAAAKIGEASGNAVAYKSRNSPTIKAKRWLPPITASA